jgi:hypothetical protein
MQNKFSYDDDGKFHSKDNQPAIHYSNGNRFWFSHGVLHREDGPAIKWCDGRDEYYLKGVKYSEEDYYSIVENDTQINKLQLIVRKR